MLRSSLAALALTAVLAATGFAGDCGCSAGGGFGSGGYSHAAWDGYCGGGNACGNTCGGGCRRGCGFPILHCTLHRIGRVFDALLPDPCCRRGCGRGASCGQPTCGIEPGCGIGMEGPADPFMDDHSPPMPVPSPTPAHDARSRSWSNARTMSHNAPIPAPALKPMPMKSAAAPDLKPVPMKTATSVKSKATARSTKSVLKVAYDEDHETSFSDDIDAPPTAPASIREVASNVVTPVRVAAKPVVTARQASAPVNPLRP